MPDTTARRLKRIQQNLQPCITYSLSVTSLDNSQIAQLHREIIPNTLPRIGYQRSFPTSIMFGSKYLGGLEIMNIYASQARSKNMSNNKTCKGRKNRG